MAAFIQVEKGELGREGEEFAADVAKFAMLFVVQFPASPPVFNVEPRRCKMAYNLLHKHV